MKRFSFLLCLVIFAVGGLLTWIDDWIELRLVLFLLAFLFMLLRPSLSRGEFGQRYGELRYRTLRYRPGHRSSNPLFTEERVEVPVSSPFSCRLLLKRPFHRLCNKIGFGKDVQTFNKAFDEKIYVLGDDPLIRTFLSSKAETQNKILELLPSKLAAIEITGEVIRFELSSSTRPNDVMSSIEYFVEELTSIQSGFRRQVSVPGRFMSSLQICIGAFGWASFWRWSHNYSLFGSSFPYTLHPTGMEIFRAGLNVGIGIEVAMLTLIWMLYRNSSAAPLLLRNSCILLLFMPFAGMQILSDVNRLYDDAAGHRVVRQVVDLEATRTRGGNPLYYMTLSMPDGSTISPGTVPLQIPPRLAIEQPLFVGLRKGDLVTIELGSGFLGFPWYRDVWSSDPSDREPGK